MITQQTAYDIWCAYDELAKAKELLKKLEDADRDRKPVDLRDAFGRPRNLQLGVPHGTNGHQLLDVHPRLAASVIRAHIAEKEVVLVAANEIARQELSPIATSATP